jgi:hypothetical protein
MILYRSPTISGRIILKRWVKCRGSDKNKRVHDRLLKYRKVAWHFKTRWDPNPDELIEE